MSAKIGPINTGVFETFETAWCPGCGNFAILSTLRQVLIDLGKRPEEVLLVGGIGQAAKLPQYLSANAFCGLHGRALPPAAAAKMVNPALTVIVDSGDGDSYGEGGNHFLHNIRRNVDLKHFVHNNQIYGLTKGQASPTSDPCGNPGDQWACNRVTPFNPLLVALAAGATFAARSFTGLPEHLAKMLTAALRHKGYALVDILQPCVSFNKHNTFAYYKERVYELDAGHDVRDRSAALARAQEYGEKIPLGIFYQKEEATYHERNPVLASGLRMVDMEYEAGLAGELCREFL